MDTKTIIWIIVAVVALIVLGIVLWGGRRRELTHRHAQAEEMREQLRHEDAEVRRAESPTPAQRAPAVRGALSGGGAGIRSTAVVPATQRRSRDPEPSRTGSCAQPRSTRVGRRVPLPAERTSG